MTAFRPIAIGDEWKPIMGKPMVAISVTTSMTATAFSHGIWQVSICATSVNCCSDHSPMQKKRPTQKKTEGMTH
jgi:hypothetical protein